MPVKFSEDEQFLIDQMAKKPEEMLPQDVDRVAELLVKSMGNMDFNKRLRAYGQTFENKRTKYEKDNNIYTPEHESILMLAKFTYKTEHYESALSACKKVQIVNKLKQQDLLISADEKISLKEYAKITLLSDIDNSEFIKKRLEFIALNSENNEYISFWQNKKLANEVNLDINKMIQTGAYKPGDISIANLNKNAVVKNINISSLPFDQKLVTYVSSYGHVAPIYLKDNTQPTFSHIQNAYETTLIDANSILASDVLRINPTKLINKKFVSGLKQYYGKDQWEEKIVELYQTICNSLQTKIESENDIPSVRANMENLAEKYYSIAEQLETNNNDLNTQEQLLKEKSTSASQQDLDELMLSIKQLKQKEEKLNIDSKKLEVQLKNLEERLESGEKTISNKDDKFTSWFSPRAIIRGHTKFIQKNDFRAIANEMFSPTEENKKMICSEFGAMTIAATISELNRIVALDLQEIGIKINEQEIFKNPIDERERLESVHPDQLIKILKKTPGLVEVHNETVDQYVKRNDLTSMETASIEKDLPNKILHILKNSKSETEFIQNANKNLEIYMDSYKVEPDIIKTIQIDAQEKFKDFYARKNEKGIFTEIKKFCKGLVVHLGLRTKEKSTKVLSAEILGHVSKIKSERAEAAKNAAKMDLVYGRVVDRSGKPVSNAVRVRDNKPKPSIGM